VSLPDSVSITCPACGHEQSFTAWQSVNVSLDKDLKQSLLAGELTQFACERCNETGTVAYPMLYHDMEQQLMIWLWPEPGEPMTEGMDGVYGQMPGFRFRVVRTFNELIEKILLFDQGCDDRETEMFKLLLRARGEETGDPIDGELLFLGVQKGEDGDDVIGFQHRHESGSDSLGFPMRMYKEVVASVLGTAALPEGTPGQWLRVDGDYAAALLMHASGEPERPPSGELRTPDDDLEPF
jgi:hypothetical protein